MFFFVPINTDAPVYHFPWATLTLITANCLIFAGALFGHIPIEEWTLDYGHIAPIEWVTSNFAHASLGHLVGNMIALWGLGLIIEGKIGWRAFFVVYFSIAIAECALEQVCMLGAQGGSLGASSVIFGLTAMALLWAPRNEITFAYFFWIIVFIRAGFFEVTVLTYSIIVLLIELVVFSLQGFHVGSSLLHLLGGGVGYGVGLYMLRRGLVDCEGWDLFSVMKGQHGRVVGDPAKFNGHRSAGRSGRGKSRKTRTRADAPSVTSQPGDPVDEGLDRSERSRQKILRYLSEQKPLAAWTELQRQRHLDPSFSLGPKSLRHLAAGLIDQERWAEAITLLEEYLERFEEGANEIRVHLAALLLHKQRRPQAALKVLGPIDRGRLSETLRQRVVKLEQRARELIDSGVIELSGRAFSAD